MSFQKNNNVDDSYNKIEIDHNDPYLNEGYIKKVNSKKFIKTPSINTTENNSEEIPKNWKFVSDSIKDNNTILESLLIYTVTWNMKGLKPNDDEIKLILPKEILGSSNKKQTLQNKICHIYVVASQECMRSIFSSFFNSNKDEWIQMLQAELGEEYILLKTETLSAMNLVIFVHFSIEKLIQDVNSSSIKTGIGNVIGNKGALAISLKYKEKTFLFIGCHLAAGHSAIENRNKDFLRINTSLSIANKSSSQEETISDQFDVCVFLGDLNYRVNINTEVATKLIQNEALDKLLEYDQLYDEAKLNNLQINNFDEGLIVFNPTYKYYPSLKENANKCIYDLSERTPSWTDRILFKSNDECLTQLKYNSIQETYTSDHKPVYALFRCDFKDLDKIFEKNCINQEHKFLENSSKSQACHIF